jgi:hypothetical protein
VPRDSGKDKAMGLWQKLPGAQPALPLDLAFEIKGERFHRLQENYRRFNALVDDALAKQGGEFVFDKQYLVSLVDQAFARTYEAALDVGAMTGSRSHKRYLRLDHLRGDLRRILAWQPQIGTDNFLIPIADIDEKDHFHQVRCGAFLAGSPTVSGG